MTERDVIIIDKLNNARAIARSMQAFVEEAREGHGLLHKLRDIESAAVRNEALLAECVSLLRGVS